MQSMRRVGLATGALTDDEINYIETQIVKTVRPMLVGRQIYGVKPLSHAGFRKYTWYIENDMGQATIDMMGEADNFDRVDLTEDYANIPIIHKEYKLHWRDVIMRRESGQDLNTQHAENAARQVAEEEDKLLLSGEYSGWPALGILSIMSDASRQTQASAGAWAANSTTDVAAAKQKLRAAGYYGPYRLVVRSTWYAKLEALISNTEKWYFQAIGELIGGVENILVSDNLYTTAGGTDSAVLVDIQPGNFDIAMGADVTNHLAQESNMNYYGKVWEALVPAIKRPTAICEITGLT